MCNQALALCVRVHFCLCVGDFVWVQSDVCGNITKPLQRVFHYLLLYLNSCECQKVLGGNKKDEPKYCSVMVYGTVANVVAK
jgi:hypothetical protein